MAGHQGCSICGHHHDFEMPASIIDAYRAGRLAIFAGAGVSTETTAVLPITLYQDVAIELGKRPQQLTESFPALMSQYCSRPNGRASLLQKIRDRFDYIESFPQLLDVSTRFHRELSTIPHLDDIVTTNWDTYFEDVAGAIPFVSAEDFVFWNTSGRKVFKIHGSVNNYGSIIATDEDYRKCRSNLNRGLLGSSLKLMLATKVVVFVGYSFTDHDFSAVYSFLKREMRGLIPHAYAVTVSDVAAAQFKSAGMTPIVTDGSYFLQIFKQHLESAGLKIPDARFREIYKIHSHVLNEHSELHSKYTCSTNPELIHCASYQDGLIDAFGRILSRKHTGEYSCASHVSQLMHTYVHIVKEKTRQGRYEDAAYARGYLNGLHYLVADDRTRKTLPVYYIFGYPEILRTLAAYGKVCRKAATLHKRAFTSAQRLARQIPPGTEFEHRPTLH